jgi:purine nucleoside permease
VQVALQYEFDAREIPLNFPTGYVPQGAEKPGQYPGTLYGTEVFELNANLRDIAAAFAKKAKLVDSSDARAYRARFQNSGFKAATRSPEVISCDVATADVFYSGTLLGEAFENLTTLITNGTSSYCMSAQEDNATLEALLRAASRGAVDFARIIVMRTASDFDRPPPGISAVENLLSGFTDGAFPPALANLYLAGNVVVKEILKGWDGMFGKGVEAGNYLGDIFGTLGGTPDFGPYGEKPVGEKAYYSVHLTSNGDVVRRDGVEETADRRLKGMKTARKA